ncbi:MAG: type III toxin-antitoxin system ToxN/AbiQ family toxin [Treponema sp.]|uniref:type III toxin-antitoxin system ToxN/AbiQ family toxin n=1 Tax=Treponema sp. TaxID=166 RepID=UPI0025F249B8|nr:type III toxin-antitoxin system ToxN/AbiQ family toxin [Treponema sp.]MBQ8680650.1 type III toxin-antitoxin system ToxN/AbiQ family toxin [Treponema sp.]
MDKLLFYEIDNKYIDFLSKFSEHLFHNAKITQTYTRKYIGILFEINDLKYFAPLSSFKPKHKRLSETVDFIKIGDMAVINLNNMFPVIDGVFSLKNPADESDTQYKTLLNNEIRIIRKKEEQIITNAKTVYNHKMTNDGKSKLSQRCNDFKLLEEKCKEYKIPGKKK